MFASDLTPTAARLLFVERKMSTDALKGKVTLIALDVTTNYCQGGGRNRLRVQPKNDAIALSYTRLGFTPDPVTDGNWYEMNVVSR